MIRSLGWCALALALAVPLSAQNTTSLSYVPIQNWSTPFLEYFIARGAMRDPSPMVRPWVVRDIAGALHGADSSRLTDTELRTVGRLESMLDTGRTSVVFAGELVPSVRAATHARRYNLREAGPGKVLPQFGLNMGLQFGPGVVVANPFLDPNLEFDPDYGGAEHHIWMRFPEAYASFRSQYFDLDFGRLSRNWGPPGMAGLLNSPVPFSYDQLYVKLGPDRVYLQMMVAKLDTLTNRSGELSNRYWYAHRLTARPWSFIDLAIWEGSLVTGPTQTLDLAYMNPAAAAYPTRDELRQAINILLGGDFEVRFRNGIRLNGSLAVDDLQFPFFGAPSNDEPPSYAFSGELSSPVGPAVIWIAYTQVSNLMYRTPDPAEVLLNGKNARRDRSGTGLARNFSDYDQTSLRAKSLLWPGFLGGVEFTLLRQGEGDFRQPFPPPSENADTPTIFVGVIEHTWRAALQGSLILPFRFSAEFDAGVHYVTNADHVAGATRTGFVGSMFLRYTLGGTWAIN